MKNGKKLERNSEVRRQREKVNRECREGKQSMKLETASKVTKQREN